MNKYKIFKTLFFGSFFFVMGLVVLWNVTTPSTIHPPEEVKSVEDVIAYINEMVEEENPPSINLTILKNGKVVFNKGFGKTGLGQNNKTKEDTVYHLWSQTKLLTAVGIVKLIENKKLTLQTNASDILPYFKAIGGDNKEYKVNVRQLLNHSSGLPDFLYNGGMGMIHLHGESSVNQTEFLKKILPNHNKLHFIPGTDSSYSNTSYIVLGAIIEKISGVPYEKFIEEKIIRAINLKSTSFVYTDEMLRRAAHGSLPVVGMMTPILMKYNEDWFDKYVIEVKDLRMWLKHFYTDYTPSTGIISTSYDMALFGQMILNGGELNGHRVLSKESIDTLLNKGHREEDKLEPRLGLGFKTWTFDENVLTGHGGGGPGFGSHLMINVKKNLVISIAANDTSVDRFNLVKVISKLDW